LSLEELARSEERDGIEQVNVIAGFAHADTPHTGVSFSIVYDVNRVSEERISALGARLRAAVEADKQLGLPDEWDLDAAIADALEKNVFPVCLVEPADNIGGGATGDGTAIFRALLAHKLTGSGVILNDPEVVAALAGQPEGSVHSLNLGGKTFSLDPGPVAVTAKLIRLTDGNYTLEDRHSHAASMSGVHMRMGPCALLDVEGIIVLITSRRSAPMDLGQWRSQGVDPATLRFIGVKAAVAHRQAYDRISKGSYWVGTPGPCTNNLRSLPFKLIRRPVFPLD
jgi:microcystin degradation protein MlrC